MNNGRLPAEKRQSNETSVVACVVFQTQDPDRVIEALRKALAGTSALDPTVPPDHPSIPLQPDRVDTWLKHPEAAEYLGISPSTLYRYACEQRIESRKLCGRLEYRRSTLDRFKDQQVRPATRWPSRGRIIPAALGSGK